jgi:hypothetical protein
MLELARVGWGAGAGTFIQRFRIDISDICLGPGASIKEGPRDNFILRLLMLSDDMNEDSQTPSLCYKLM